MAHHKTPPHTLTLNDVLTHKDVLNFPAAPPKKAQTPPAPSSAFAAAVEATFEAQVQAKKVLIAGQYPHWYSQSPNIFSMNPQEIEHAAIKQVVYEAMQVQQQAQTHQQTLQAQQHTLNEYRTEQKKLATEQVDIQQAQVDAAHTHAQLKSNITAFYTHCEALNAQMQASESKAGLSIPETHTWYESLWAWLTQQGDIDTLTAAYPEVDFSTYLDMQAQLSTWQAELTATEQTLNRLTTQAEQHQQQQATLDAQIAAAEATYEATCQQVCTDHSLRDISALPEYIAMQDSLVQHYLSPELVPVFNPDITDNEPSPPVLAPLSLDNMVAQPPTYHPHFD